MMFKNDIENKENFLNECDIMKNLKSINIIQYYENFEENEFYFIIMELCNSNLI